MTIDPLMAFPGYALRRASIAVMVELGRRIAGLGLGLRPTEATVLVVIEANPGITQSEVGQLLDIARANMAPLTARLFERDLIDRERVDGRSQGLSLSAAGRQLTRKVLQVMSEHEAALLAKIPRAHHEIFVNALHALWDSQKIEATALRQFRLPKPGKRSASKARTGRD
jgi:DNA-binding MarR family transcriptional regulator